MLAGQMSGRWLDSRDIAAMLSKVIVIETVNIRLSAMFSRPANINLPTKHRFALPAISHRIAPVSKNNPPHPSK